MDKILEIKSFFVGYHDNIVLKDINLIVFEKDFLGLIGPNGGGKTTLLKAILGLLRPVSGTINYFKNNKSNIKQFFGYLPQFSMLDINFPINVIDVILSGLIGVKKIFERYTKNDRKKAEEILDKMGILEFKNKHIMELSGGQLQRVYLGRAIISSPRLLILDEPNTFIDKNFSIDFYEILKELNKEIAIILSTHDLGIISSLVKNIACINGSLYYHPSNELTEEIMEGYRCPVDIITHGKFPHRVLKEHGEKDV